MTHLKINLDKISPAIIDLIVGSLKIGQILVLPTDTIYGLSCLATDAWSIKKIYHLKKRDSKKPVLILVSSLKMAKKYVDISKTQVKILESAWLEGTRPTTFILKNRHRLPRELARNSKGLAVRLPKSDFLIKIIDKIGYPLVSTSLNFSGQKNITNLKKLAEYFPKKNNRPDLIIDAGRAPRRKPSRLIDLSQPEKEIVIRD